MIDGNDEEGYALYCDYCGDDSGELFGRFQDAVDWKVDRGNRWTSVKGKDGEWQELCPACGTPGTIAKLKGMKLPAMDRKAGKTASELADMAAEDFEGF